MSNKKFSGSDAFSPDSMEHRTCQIMMKSELRDGVGAYQMSNAVALSSGPSFGPFQYDIGSNQDGRRLLESIAESATNAEGHRIVSDLELESIKSHFYKPFKSFTDADSKLYDQLKPKLDSALSSDAGIKAINADFVPKVRQKVTSMNAIIDGMAPGPNKTFMSNSDVAKLILIDTKNQYGDAVNDGLKRFVSLTSSDAAMGMPGRPHGTTIKVQGAFGLDDMVRYKLDTRYGQTDQGARDVLRRLSHCIEAAGVENVKASISEEDKEFFKTGLEKYLKDHGRDAKMLNSSELNALAVLAGREQHRGHPRTTLKPGSSGPQVATLQRDLAILGYQQGLHPLKADGDFGPATRSAIEAFQRSHNLTADGIVGPATGEALKHATLQQSAMQTLTLDHPQHPGHPLYQQALAGVGRLDDAQGRTADMHSYNLSGVLAVAARREGLERIDRVILSEDATRAIAVQGDFKSPLRRFADVDVVSGISTPLAKSSTGWSQLQPAAPQGIQPPTPLMPSEDLQATQSAMQR